MYNTTILTGLGLIIFGIAFPPMFKIYSPIEISVWVGMFLLISEYEKISKHNIIIRFGKYGSIIFLLILIFGVVLYLIPSSGLNKIFAKQIYYLSNPATLIIDKVFSIPLKELPSGDLLVDKSYLRKCISIISDMLLYVIIGFSTGAALRFNNENS